MVQIKEIHSNDNELYKYMEQLIVSAFPENEYRPLNMLKEYIDHVDNFHMNILFDDEQPFGIISYWDFNDFYYVEHFTTDQNFRNNGYGSKSLQTLCKQLNKAIVLEIELPNTEMAQRRQSFYERNEFITWPNDYIQPPYREEGEPLPLKICCYGNLDPKKDFERVKRTIHHKVYKYFVD